MPYSLSAPLSPEGVVIHPNHDDRTIQHLLTAPHPLQPLPTEVEHDDQNRRIANERRAHDIVSRALAEMTSSTEAEGSCDAEKHLCAP